MSCLSLREVTPGGWGSLSVFTHLWVLLTPPPLPLPGKTAAPGPGRGGGCQTDPPIKRNPVHSRHTSWRLCFDTWQQEPAKKPKMWIFKRPPVRNQTLKIDAHQPTNASSSQEGREVAQLLIPRGQLCGADFTLTRRRHHCRPDPPKAVGAGMGAE